MKSHKTRKFSQFFYALMDLFTDWIDRSLPFYIPEAWNRYPYWAEPFCIYAIIRITPPPSPDSLFQALKKWGRRETEMHEKGADGKKVTGIETLTRRPFSPQSVSSHFIFMFVLSQFCGPDYLGAWIRLPLHVIVLWTRDQYRLFLL